MTGALEPGAAACGRSSAPARLAAGYGSPRIANPLAPGSGVQLAAGEAGHLEAQQIVTGGDAGAAHGDQILEAAARETFLPATLELGGGQKTAVRAEIGGKRVIHGAGYVSGHRVDGFHRACIALLGARIDQHG